MTELEKELQKQKDLETGECSLCGHSLQPEAASIDAVEINYPFDGMTSKYAYIKHPKEQEILSIHCVGYDTEDGSFHSMDSWINVYDKDKNFKYSASRFYESFEDCVKGYIDDGWEIVKE